MAVRLSSRAVPEPVRRLLETAAEGRLLTDVDTMASHLTGAGWLRESEAGSWTCPQTPAWTVQSSDHDPGLSVFAMGDDDLVTSAAGRLHALVDSGGAGSVRRGQPDPDWPSWVAGGVVISLNATTSRQLGRHRVDAVLQLALERADTPSEGRPRDPWLDLRVAREGSAVARWYPAGSEHLGDEAVAVLALDDDPMVVAALTAGEEHRRITRSRGQR